MSGYAHSDEGRGGPFDGNLVDCCRSFPRICQMGSGGNGWGTDHLHLGGLFTPYLRVKDVLNIPLNLGVAVTQCSWIPRVCFINRFGLKTDTF